MQNLNPNDLTATSVEPDEKYGVFEPDPNDPFLQRYVPSDKELDRLNSWLKDEIETAIADDQPLKDKKLRLLNAYRGIPDGKEQILTMPLIKRAVRRNVAYVKGKILGETPLVTVKPTSNKSVQVLVEDPQFGTVPLEKTSEEVAQSLEWWMDWKLRNRIGFSDVVEIAATEAKRGQTPTWLKVAHKSEKRTTKVPKFEKKGPLAVTYASKDDVEAVAGDPDKILNVSTYSMLMPADEQDPQESRWLSEDIPQTSEQLRRALYNGDYPLIPKSEWEAFIAEGLEIEPPEAERRMQASEQRIASVPKGKHNIKEVWLYHTVPQKKTIASVDDSGEPTEKTTKTFQEYSMVGHFHQKHGRLMSLLRNPRDDERRPYVPIYDRKEPFRHTGESLAEDVGPYQKAQSQLVSLEIRGAVVATTPVFYVQPGSVAGEWLAEHEVEPGDSIPRMRPEEIEDKPLGQRPESLVPLIAFFNGEYEKNTQIGGLQLGLNVPSRTPSSSIHQILTQGETDAEDFLERFCGRIVEALEMYVRQVQQYMRTGEVIPFDPETKATIEAGLRGEDAQQVGESVPVRFPMAPITDQFTFAMTAISKESQQADFEKYVSFKQIVDADGEQLAKIVGPLASGNLPPSVVQILLQQVERSERLMEKIGNLVAKDGKKYAIPAQLLEAAAKEGAQLAQMHQENPPPPPPPEVKYNVSLKADLTPLQEQAIAEQNGFGGINGAQGVGSNGQPSGAQPNGGGLAGHVQQQGGPPVPNGSQAAPSQPPVGAGRQ